VFLGAAGLGISYVGRSNLLDPLVVSMVLGVVVRTWLGAGSRLGPGPALATRILLPVGIVFYAFTNLNFGKVLELPASMSALLVAVVVVFFFATLLLGRAFRLRRQIAYLTATGSAICGASAIAITSRAVDAEPDDVSTSLLAVTFAAVLCLFIFLPFLAAASGFAGETYALLAGSVLQFTGFVKVAVRNLPYLETTSSPERLTSLALSVKAARYLVLIAAIPIVASLARKRLFLPAALWYFLGAGAAGSAMYAAAPAMHEGLAPLATAVHSASWSVALASIGLQADARVLLSNNGAKALGVAVLGSVIATAVFFVGYRLLGP